MRVAVPVERDFHAFEPVLQHPIDDVRREQKTVGDDARAHPHAAGPRRLPRALGDLVHHRQIEQGLATEEHDDEPFGRDAIELALDPFHYTPGRLERHLVGEFVVVAVIALEAVVAGKITLQRRQDGDMQLAAIIGRPGEEAVQCLLIGGAIGDEESVGGQDVDCFTRIVIERAGIAGFSHSIEQCGHIARHHQLSVGQRVHEEHVVGRPARPSERDPKVEH